jgi:hypothetical protein
MHTSSKADSLQIQLFLGVFYDLQLFKDLGGTVEGFLSKDIDLFITDKKNGDLSTTCKEEKTKSIQISNNLSRGTNKS